MFTALVFCLSLNSSLRLLMYANDFEGDGEDGDEVYSNYIPVF